MATVEGCYAHYPLRRCLYDNKHCLPHLTPFTRPVYLHTIYTRWSTSLSRLVGIMYWAQPMPGKYLSLWGSCREGWGLGRLGADAESLFSNLGVFLASWDAFPVPRCQRVFQELTEGTERWGLVLGVDGVCHFPACLPLGSAQVTLS